MPMTLDLAEFLRADDIHLRFSAASVIDAIPLLLRPAVERRIRDRVLADQIVEAAVRRESDTSTRCGSLSLPHARSSAVSDFILAVGANATGVIAGQPEPRLMFAFVSPESRRDQHLQLLAALAKLSQNAWLVAKIAGASDSDQVLAALRAAI
jgi:mannitol/fructose-specific phosphotransferase system IIA component (Ntr-type)